MRDGGTATRQGRAGRPWGGLGGLVILAILLAQEPQLRMGRSERTSPGGFPPTTVLDIRPA
jgi:hypothetical protein